MFILHSHDYNAELGNIPHLQSFEEKFPQEFQDFERGFIKFMHYVEELESGIIVKEPKRQLVKTFIELNTDNSGYPILPGPDSDPTKDGLEYQKRLLRSFLTTHYSKCIHFRHRRYCVLMLARVCMWSAGGEISLAIICHQAD